MEGVQACGICGHVNNPGQGCVLAGVELHQGHNCILRHIQVKKAGAVEV